MSTNAQAADRIAHVDHALAVAKADPNALRMALYHATRDPELAAMKVDQVPFWGGAFYAPMLAPAHHDVVRSKALAFIRDGMKARAPAPREAELRAMMDLCAGEPVNEVAYEVGRGDIVSDEFPLGVQWSKEPLLQAKQQFHVTIIGAGFGGMAAAIQLSRVGIPYVIIERNAGVGGTWFTNDYPEARVDIASHHYQFSFMKNYPWKHWFATQPELRDYADAVADIYGLRNNIRFSTELAAARWDEVSQRWQLKLRDADGSESDLVSNAIISAAGTFNSPKLPSFRGLESFRGKSFHTTQWDHTFDINGKRIALIGVGSTGAQLMPALARSAAHLSVFQRSPQWVSAIPGYRDPVPPEVQWMFDNFPHYWGWYNFSVFYMNMGGDPEGLQNVDRQWQAKGGQISERNDALRAFNLDYIGSKVGHDPELMRKLVPDFPPFAKRPVVDNGWFDALNRKNVSLVTEPIETITPNGIRTTDGIERAFDLIVFGLGFNAEDYLWPVEYVGRGGISLAEAWAEDGARAYLGVTMPDFPNLFILYGPNAQCRGGGIIKWLEIWARYAVKAIVKMIEGNHRSLDVKREVFEEYNAQLDAGLGECVWEYSKSYYVNKHGRQNMNMPFKPVDYYEWIKEPKLQDYNVE